MQKLKIFIVAGEPSGDNIGAKLMANLKSMSNDIEFFGVGGPAMTKQGFKSIFPIHEISLMGFLEIIPHIFNLIKRIDQTVSAIKKIKPDVVITIDSPGFNNRVAKKIKGLIKLVHYVAPTVWAYKKNRAKKIAKLYDHLLCLLPFEPNYFIKHGLASSFIGHPIIEDVKLPSSHQFRLQYNIDPNAKILVMMPGSRKSELDRLLPIFLETAANLTGKITDLVIVIISTFELAESIKLQAGSSKLKIIITTNDDNKYLALAAANLALIKSGTSSLEVALAKVPMVVAYKVNFVSAFIIKMMLKIPYVSLVNIIEQRMVIEEFLQERCTASNLTNALERLINNKTLTEQQITTSTRVAKIIGAQDSVTPSAKAAKVVLDVIKGNFDLNGPAPQARG